MTGEALHQSHFASGFDAGRARAEAEVQQLKAENAAMATVVKAAREFYQHHQRGQPGTPDTLYPMTYGVLDQWHTDWDYRLKTMGIALDRLDAAEKTRTATPEGPQSGPSSAPPQPEQAN